MKRCDLILALLMLFGTTQVQAQPASCVNSVMFWGAAGGAASPTCSSIPTLTTLTLTGSLTVPTLTPNTQILAPNGTALLPSISFLNDAATGFFRQSANTIGVSGGGSNTFSFNGSGQLIGGLFGSVSLPTFATGGVTTGLFSTAGTNVQVSVSGAFAGGWNATGYIMGAGAALLANATPTISSGFGTSPSIVNNNGSATFRVNVGTGGTATTGVIGLPSAVTGWNCIVQDSTNNTATRQTSNTQTTVSVTAVSAWAANDILFFQCMAF